MRRIEDVLPSNYYLLERSSDRASKLYGFAMVLAYQKGAPLSFRVVGDPSRNYFVFLRCGEGTEDWFWYGYRKEDVKVYFLRKLKSKKMRRAEEQEGRTRADAHRISIQLPLIFGVSHFTGCPITRHRSPLYQYRHQDTQTFISKYLPDLQAVVKSCYNRDIGLLYAGGQYKKYKHSHYWEVDRQE